MNDTAFSALFDPRAIVLGLAPQNRDEVLHGLVDAAVTAGSIEAAHRDDVIAAVRSREALGSTGIGGGIAIPHAKTDHVKRIATAVAIARHGIDYKAVDGEPCDIFFLLVSPKQHHETHLAILRWLSRAKRNPDFTRFLRMARAPNDVLAVLEEANART